MSAQLPSTKRYAGLTADEYGTGGDQPTIVLLHGISFDRTMWRPAMDELRAIDPDRRVLAFDLPGHGDSPDATSYSFEAVLDAVRSAIVEAGLDAPVMVGHSAAVGTAAMYAARYPTSGVVAVDGSFMVGEFAALLQSMRGALAGPGFADAWARITGPVFGLDGVAPEVRAFVSETCRPRAGGRARVLGRAPGKRSQRVAGLGDGGRGRHPRVGRPGDVRHGSRAIGPRGDLAGGTPPGRPQRGLASKRALPAPGPPAPVRRAVERDRYLAAAG